MKRTVSVMRQNIASALITVALLLAGVFLSGVTIAIGMLVPEASVLGRRPIPVAQGAVGCYSQLKQ